LFHQLIIIIYNLTGLNVQFFDEESNSIVLQNLCCAEIFDKHTADNIESWITDKIEEFEINKNQILSISTDSGANIAKAVNQMISKYEKTSEKLLSESNDEVFENWTQSEDEEENDEIFNDDENLMNQYQDADINLDCSSISIYGAPVRNLCSAHKLQLAVNDFLFWEKKSKDISSNRKKVLPKDLNKFKCIILKVQKLAAKLRTHTVKLMLQLEEGNEKDFRTPLLNQATRWSSTYNMLERLLNFKDFCIKYQNHQVFKGI
jgi:hypothetical protein